MMGFINIGEGLSNAGNSIAQTAGNAALEQQKANLESGKLELANSLAAAREHTARVETGQIAEGQSKQLSLIPQEVSIDAYLKAAGHPNGLAEFGYQMHNPDGTVQLQTTPPAASGGGPATSAPGEPTTGAGSGSPASGGGSLIPGGVVPIGGKGKVMGLALPPGWTMQQAAVAGPDGLAKAWAEWSKPENNRPGSTVSYFDFASGTMKTLYRNPNAPVGSFYDQDTNTYVKIGGADAAIRAPEEIRADVAVSQHGREKAIDVANTLKDVYDPVTQTMKQMTEADILRAAKSGAPVLSAPNGTPLTGQGSQGAQNDGSFHMRDGSIIPPPPKFPNQGGGAGGVQAGPSAAQKATQGVYEETIKGFNDAVLPAAQAVQRFQAMGEALKSFQSGAWANQKVQIGRQLIAAGMPRTLVDDLTSADPAKAQIIIKNNFSAALNTLAASRLGRITQNEIFALQENLANPKLEPEANLEIIAQAIGIARFQQALAGGWNAALQMGYDSPLTYQQEFLDKNPLQRYVDEARTQIGPLKGMPGVTGFKYLGKEGQ